MNILTDWSDMHDIFKYLGAISLSQTEKYPGISNFEFFTNQPTFFLKVIRCRWLPHSLIIATLLSVTPHV